MEASGEIDQASTVVEQSVDVAERDIFPVCWGETAARLAVSSPMLAYRSPAHNEAALAAGQEDFCHTVWTMASYGT